MNTVDKDVLWLEAKMKDLEENSTNFWADYTIFMWEVGERAIPVRKLIFEVIHTVEDYEELERRMKWVGLNKIFNVLCKMKRERMEVAI
jgi:hypothetical protein